MTVFEDEDGSQVYRDFADSSITVRQTKGYFPAYAYEDNWVVPEWSIKNKTKDINGLETRKAIGEFRGNTYEVWYATEINLPYGPWKLFGLPGIIVEAKETKVDRFDLRLKSVHIPCPTEWEIKSPVADEKKELKEHVHFLDNYYIFKFEARRSKMPADMARRVSPMRPPTDKPRGNYLEKIYEWEDKEPTWETVKQ